MQGLWFLTLFLVFRILFDFFLFRRLGSCNWSLEEWSDCELSVTQVIRRNCGDLDMRALETRMQF